MINVPEQQHQTRILPLAALQLQGELGVEVTSVAHSGELVRVNETVHQQSLMPAVGDEPRKPETQGSELVARHGMPAQDVEQPDFFLFRSCNVLLVARGREDGHRHGGGELRLRIFGGQSGEFLQGSRQLGHLRDGHDLAADSCRGPEWPGHIADRKQSVSPFRG